MLYDSNSLESKKKDLTIYAYVFVCLLKLLTAAKKNVNNLKLVYSSK